VREPRDYGEPLDRKLEAGRERGLVPAGVDVDFDTELYDNPLFWIGVHVEYGLIGETFEECNP